MHIQSLSMKCVSTGIQACQGPSLYALRQLAGGLHQLFSGFHARSHATIITSIM